MYYDDWSMFYVMRFKFKFIKATSNLHLNAC